MFKNLKKILFLITLSIFFLSSSALSHFGTILPMHSHLDQFQRQTKIKFAFLHPFEQTGMPLVKPEQVKIYNLSTQEVQDYTQKLNSTKLLGNQAWECNFDSKRPGVYSIVMHPQPYWEPAEDLFIKHISKAYIAAFGVDSGWDKPTGLQTEIVPLTRPFGLYAGNIFQGKVLFDQKSVPGAEIEVEYYNLGQKSKAPNEYMITQVVKADKNGVFSYSPPVAGWWGFSALNKANYTIKHEGKEKKVELGAVIWVKFYPWSK